MEKQPADIEERVVTEVLNSTDMSFQSIVKMILINPDRAEVVVMWLFLAVLVAGLIWLLKAWNDDQNNDIVIADLICTDGKLNESKMARFGAFLVSTWAFVYLIITQDMTEWYFIGYMTAWVGNALFNKYMSDRSKASDGETSHGQHDMPPEEEEYEARPRPRKRGR